MMRCFLPCFCASKRRKHLHSSNGTPSRDKTRVADGDLKSTQLTDNTEVYINDTESRIKLEEQSNNGGIKKITFDLNESANEELSTKEAEKKLEQRNTEPQKAGNEEVSQISDGPKAFADNLENEKKGEDEEEGEVTGKSLPEESSESLFSLSIDSRKQFTTTGKAEYEVNSATPVRGAFCKTKEEFDSGVFGSSQSTSDGVQIVSQRFNPIENLAQRKSIKVSKAKDSTDVPSNSNSKRKVNFDLNVNTNEESSAKELIERSNQNKEDHEKLQINEWPKSVASAKSSDFSQYRYRDCSDEECGDFDLDENDSGDKFVDDEEKSEGEEGGEVNLTLVQEESSESLFSLSTCSRKQVSAAENAENEVNSPIPTRGTESSLSSESRIQNVPSLLSPIQNSIQGKVVKVTEMQPPTKCEKENMNMNSEQDIDVTMSAEPNLKVSNGKTRHKKFKDKKQEEIRVDTSLSSWLVETETTPKSKNSTNIVGDSTPISKRSLASPVSHEDRPILGALTIEELRNFSASTPTSRRSKISTPDDTPIIGTVGSYWSHTKQAINSDSSSCCGKKSKPGSKSRENAKLKRNSTPVKARLEGAFEASVAQL